METLIPALDGELLVTQRPEPETAGADRATTHANPSAMEKVCGRHWTLLQAHPGSLACQAGLWSKHPTCCQYVSAELVTKAMKLFGWLRRGHLDFQVTMTKNVKPKGSLAFYAGIQQEDSGVPWGDHAAQPAPQPPPALLPKLRPGRPSIACFSEKNPMTNAQRIFCPDTHSPKTPSITQPLPETSFLCSFLRHHPAGYCEFSNQILNLLHTNNNNNKT
ncbi:PREDICTED: uncharacterized protein LOC102005270 [Chinchilla lanigera]|uniref:uncharacterized protein LOC102005270 n=1 Tax=Chinchilla lanigera TaxID=34839 RepID=UPI00038ED7C3|nr:PREDICTED: uncharacterized protein LOC102005270 [Chinchilla lanigera]